MLTKLKIRHTIFMCVISVLSVFSISSKTLSMMVSKPAHDNSAGIFAMLKERIHDNVALNAVPVNTTIQVAGDEYIEDDDDLVNLKVSLAYHSFCMLNKNTVNPIRSEISFDQIKCTLYPKKYLALSILKI